MTIEKHEHYPMGMDSIEPSNDLESALCDVCGAIIDRFWIHDDYDQLPFWTKWEVSK
jgi:hypothetical protein